MSPEVQTDQQSVEESKQDDPRLVGPDSKAVSSSSPRSRINPFVFAVIVVVLLAVGVSWYLRHHPDATLFGNHGGCVAGDRPKDHHR